MTAGLEAVGLTRRFSPRGPAAVDDATFSAPAGAITTLLGPSGSGKSTVLRLVAGLEQPDAGRVIIGGVDASAVPPQRRGAGFVFQSYALFPHMTVRRNIGFGLRARRRQPAEIDRRVDDLLATVELDGHGDRLPAELSGGERQRVAFARALAIEPAILLLDEPFGALDAQVRKSLREWLRRFQERLGGRVTTLLVTHDQEEAMELSQHVVVINEGRVAQAGTPQEIYDHPASPFVASFVGGANLLCGRVKNGHAAVGSFAVAVPDKALAAEGTAALAFVRPHEVKLSRGCDADAPHVALARVERLVFLGAYCRVALRLPDGGALTVEMPHAEIEALGIQEGDRVMADLKDAKIFVGDYAI